MTNFSYPHVPITWTDLIKAPSCRFAFHPLQLQLHHPPLAVYFLFLLGTRLSSVFHFTSGVSLHLPTNQHWGSSLVHNKYTAIHPFGNIHFLRADSYSTTTMAHGDILTYKTPSQPADAQVATYTYLPTIRTTVNKDFCCCSSSSPCCCARGRCSPHGRAGKNEIFVTRDVLLRVGTS